jgi:hypothetical protein
MDLNTYYSNTLNSAESQTIVLLKPNQRYAHTNWIVAAD